MQSNRSRVLVGLGSLAAIVALFIVFAGGKDDEKSDGETSVAATTTTTGDPGPDGSGEPAKLPKPQFDQIMIVGGGPKGGVQDLSYSKGDQIRIEVSSDTADEIHIHGYDLSEEVEAGGKVRFDFAAEIDGVFEIELENSAVPIAQLTVKP
ncbi:MAG: hypothetical protein WBF18_13765 [Solirubrobacterales bacterium]